MRTSGQDIRHKARARGIESEADATAMSNQKSWGLLADEWRCCSRSASAAAAAVGGRTH